MNCEEFLWLVVDGYNCILLFFEIFVDFDMLLLIYLKLVDVLNFYLLELVQGGEKWGCYLIIGLLCCMVLWVYDY